MSASTTTAFVFMFLVGLCSQGGSIPQQYTGNSMLNCDQENVSSVRGYVCGGGGDGDASCPSYILFRATAPYYTTPFGIASLLGASAGNISLLNSIPDVVSPLPAARPVLVPVTCSCTSAGEGLPRYYQHDASYTLNWDPENYYTIANETYQGLTTCQAMAAQNPLHKMLNLSVGDQFKVPIRCACPDKAQLAEGYKYVLTYSVTWGDDIQSIADRFQSDAAAILKANRLREKDIIFPFTTLLVPVKKQLTGDMLSLPPAPPAPSPQASNPVDNKPRRSSRSSKKWLGAGIAIGAGGVTLLLVGAVAVARIAFLWTRAPTGALRRSRTAGDAHGFYSSMAQQSYSSQIGLTKEARLAVMRSTLVSYTYEDLQKATGSFEEKHRISGSVYRGVFNGDWAAVKKMKGIDVSGEVAILKQLNHSSLIRISGFCVHEGNTFLVFQYAQNGSLADWLHGGGKPGPLGWKRRARVAYDVADGLNYLHNNISPAFVHKDLRSSNVLLDGEFRAKLSNFGLARALPENDIPGGDQHLTRHVVGTQGYMPPEYLEHGLVTPKVDIFAFGVLLLELLSGREAVADQAAIRDGDVGCEGTALRLLWEEIGVVMAGDDMVEKLTEFMDPKLRTGGEQCYPLDAAIAMAQLARRCVARHPDDRPTTTEVFMALTAVQSASLAWAPWSGSKESSSLVLGR